MKFTKTRLIAATALASLLIGGGAIAPATAATPVDDTAVTITGHVTDRDGKPITGIHALAACPCDSPMGAHQGDEDVTNAAGYYSLLVQRRFAPTLYFSDPKEKFFGKPGKLTAVSGGYVANARLAATSTISGTITAINGAKAHLTAIHFYDATTGKGKGSAHAHADGTYEGHLKPGSYKVRFGGENLYTNEVWYGGAATEAESPTVTVKYAGTVSGIDGTVTPTPSINGKVTIDGKTPLRNVRERLSITIADASGTRVGKTVSSSVFSFVRTISPGTYTITATPTVGSNAYVQPLAQTVTLAPGTAIRGLVLNLTSHPATSASTRSSGVSFDQTSKGIAKSGTVFKGTITVESYGSVKGGKALVYVKGKKVDSRVLPASGRFSWSFRPAKVEIGGRHPFTVKVRFLGTDTARPRSVYVYYLGGA